LIGFGEIILIFCEIISLIIANSGAGSGVESLLAFEIGAAMIVIHLPYPVLLWSIDAFMAILLFWLDLKLNWKWQKENFLLSKKLLFPSLLQ